MADGVGDVAFVRNTTVQEYVKQPNVTMTEQASFFANVYCSTPIWEQSIPIILSVSLSVCVFVSVCLSVCEYISATAGPMFTKFCAQLPCGRGSVSL